MIHPTAIVSPGAQLGQNIDIGPYSIIEEGVQIGDGCSIGPHVLIRTGVEMGSGNIVHAGAVLGDAPQDLRYRGESTRLIIGNQNIFREHVTLHRSNKVSEPTRIGSNNFLMANSHIGHNSELGNNIIIANGALIGGHCVIHDRVFISGNCLVHQFARIGTMALMQGGSAISKDLAPYAVARGANKMSGINTVGLRRAGLDSATRLEIRKLYHFLFRSGATMQKAVSAARVMFPTPACIVLLDFIESSKRGICPEARRQKRSSQEDED